MTVFLPWVPWNRRVCYDTARPREPHQDGNGVLAWIFLVISSPEWPSTWSTIGLDVVINTEHLPTGLKRYCPTPEPHQDGHCWSSLIFFLYLFQFQKKKPRFLAILVLTRVCCWQYPGCRRSHLSWRFQPQPQNYPRTERGFYQSNEDENDFFFFISLNFNLNPVIEEPFPWLFLSRNNIRSVNFTRIIINLNQ